MLNGKEQARTDALTPVQAAGVVNGGTTSMSVHQDTRPKRMPSELVAALYRPMPPEAIKPHPSKAYLSSVKAIFVIERLNEVFGIGGWTYRTQVVEKPLPELRGDKERPGMIVVRVVLSVPEYGIRLEQFGGSDNEDRGDAYKGAVTDALSKIGSYLGIAIDVYKGGGPTKQQPRGSAVVPSRAAAAAAAKEVAKAKIATMTARKGPQPAVALAEAIPEAHEPEPYYEEIPLPEEERTQLEAELIASIEMEERKKAAAPMVEAFAALQSRYLALSALKTFFALLGLHGVTRAEEFAESPGGLAAGRACFQEMRLDIASREAKRAAR
jgi:Rad52/22 family double-strand break repair protein